MPLPRGRKSRPTMFSKTELFPLDCPPTTAICGRSISFPPMNEKVPKVFTNNGEDFLDVIDHGDQSLHSKIGSFSIHGFNLQDLFVEIWEFGSFRISMGWVTKMELCLISDIQEYLLQFVNKHISKVE